MQSVKKWVFLAFGGTLAAAIAAAALIPGAKPGIEGDRIGWFAPVAMIDPSQEEAIQSRFSEKGIRGGCPYGSKKASLYVAFRQVPMALEILKAAHFAEEKSIFTLIGGPREKYLTKLRASEPVEQRPPAYIWTTVGWFKIAELEPSTIQAALHAKGVECGFVGGGPYTPTEWSIDVPSAQKSIAVSVLREAPFAGRISNLEQ